MFQTKNCIFRLVLMALMAIQAVLPHRANADDEPPASTSNHANHGNADIENADDGGADRRREDAEDTEGAIEVAPIDVQATRSSEAQSDHGVGRLISDTTQAASGERSLEDSAFVTVVRVDERAGETTSVAEVLAESMGVTVRSLGGLGSFSSISVRGAASGNTAVSIDGIPISRVASATADIGRLSLDSFSEVQLYRGAVPVELGASALGGALDLHTPIGKTDADDTWTASMGAGSFATRHLSVRWLGESPGGATGYHVSGSYQGTTGDFSYYDDGGTNLDTSDDELVARRNNHHDRVAVVARARTERGQLTLEGGGRAFFGVQGLPGRGSAQSATASAETFGQVLDARVSKRQLFGSPRLLGTAALYGSLEWQHYQDRAGEVRLGVQDARQWWLSTGGAARLAIDAGDAHLLSLGAETRLELAVIADGLQPGQAREVGWRTGAALSAVDEITLGADERIALAPALRLDWLYTVPMADSNQPVVGEDQAMPRTDMFFSPRLSARMRVIPGLAVKGSAGYYMREPTVPELFGGRGVHVGNPALLTERGVSSDLGVSLAPARAFGALDRLFLESAVFARRPRDIIVYRTTLGGSFNLGNATMYGVEAALSMRVLGSVTASANYTWVRTRQDSPLPSYDDKPLPHAPEQQVYLRVDAAHALIGRLAVVWAELSITSGNFLDRAGLFEVPMRRFVGAGLKFEIEDRAILAIEVKNLLDERVEYIEYDPPPRPDLTRSPRAIADFYGYPLPGRALYLTLEWKR
jgi:vitamin B12 transporter